MKAGKNDNLYDLISAYIDISEEGINVLEEQIDCEIQSEYYECVRRREKSQSAESIIREKDQIFDKNISVNKKKKLLVQLASINNVEAYRTLEKYAGLPKNTLHQWAYLAFQESKLLLESHFLDENKILISTGLGGKGLKIRYFIVFFTYNGAPITLIQQNIIKNELQYAFQKNNAEIEDIVFEDGFASMLSIIPIHVPAQKIVNRVLESCNEFGRFLFNDYIITNLKVLSMEDIQELLAVNNIF